MKISKIDIFPLTIPLKGSFRNSRLARNSQQSVVLKVETSGGWIGVGNVDPDPGYSDQSFSDILEAIRRLSRSVIGMDPLNILSVLDRMDRVLAGFLDAKAAIAFMITGGVRAYSHLIPSCGLVENPGPPLTSHRGVSRKRCTSAQR